MTETGHTLGPYQLEDALGGTRTVFRARHVVTGDVVCVKLLPEHLRLDAINRGRRKRELLATRQVRHHGVGRPLDFVDAGGRLFLVMEYVEGAPLSMALFGGVTLPVSRALRVVRGACEAVAAAHAAHATHGCLEADKLLVGQEGDIHVVGFGFRDEDALKNPGPDAPADVDLCTAPERWSGAFETPEADVWALGALLYRCLSGAYPFEAETRAELSHRVQTTDVAPPRFEAGVVERPAIEAVVLRALARDPVLRYPDAAVLARALVELEAMVPADPVADEGPIAIDDADVEPLTLDDPPPPPPDDEAIAALAALEDAIQSHEAFVDPFAAGLLQGPEAVAPTPHAAIGDDDAPDDERTRVERASNDATTVEAPSLDGTTVERASVEVPSQALPSMEQPPVEEAPVELPPLEEAPVVEPVPEPRQELAHAPVEPPANEPPALEEAAEVDIDLDEEDATAVSLPLPPPPSLDDDAAEVTAPALRPPPIVEPLPPRRSRAALYAAALGLVAVVAAFVVLDPLALRSAGEGAEASAAPEPPVAAATSAAVPSPDDAQPQAPTPTEPEGAAVADAGTAPAPVAASSSDAGPEPLASADAGSAAPEVAAATAAATADESEGTDDAVAAEERSPKEAYEAHEQALEKTLEERGLLWKDDRALDRLRLKARRQAKARRYQAAARTAEAAVETASEVAIDDKLVKRKLLRYVKRRKQVRDDDVEKRARALETRARKHLKDGEHEEANALLNAGLRLMYRPNE